MATHKYDIFISYRRAGGAQYARILQLMLSQRGYRVFLDYDELKEGIFGQKIRAAIDEAPVFILVLSKDALNRCANEDDAVRNEILRAYKGHKHFIPVNPDKSFDGIKTDVPKEVREVADDIQRSEIDFGQALGVTVDLMIKNRLVPTLGERKRGDKVDENGEAAVKTLEEIKARNKFIKRVITIASIVAVLIVLATCFIFWRDHQKKMEAKAKEKTRIEMRENLNEKYKEFGLQLSPNLTVEQMGTIDTILTNMSEVKPDSLWMSQYEFTVGQWNGILGKKYQAVEKTLPMTDVSFGEVNMTLLDSLRNMTNIEFDLPTVEEWQYAARGGRNHETTIYCGSNDADAVAWYRNNSDGHTHPSDGQQGKEPNMLDLYDMSGNVSELCNTPIEAGVDNVKYVVCGGNFNSPKQNITVTSKEGFATDEKSKTVGFRIVIRKY